MLIDSHLFCDLVIEISYRRIQSSDSWLHKVRVEVSQENELLGNRLYPFLREQHVQYFGKPGSQVATNCKYQELGDERNHRGQVIYGSVLRRPLDPHEEFVGTGWTYVALETPWIT